MDDRHPVAQLLDLAHDVGREDDALPLRPERVDRLHHRAGDEYVETGGRLVKDHHRRVVDDRAGDGDLLLHAGRHLRPQHVPKVSHLQLEEDLLQSRLKDILGHPVQPTVVFYHFPGGHAVVDAGVVGHEPDVRADALGLSGDIEARDGGVSAGGLEHGTQHAQTSRLPGSIGAQQAKDLTGLDIKGDVIEGQHVAPPQIEERFRQVLDVNHAGAVASRERRG